MNNYTCLSVNRTRYLVRFLCLLGFGLLSAQETTVKTGTDIFTKPDPDAVTGKLNPGTDIRKIKLDRSGEYIKATMEFYIPVSALEDARVSLPVGAKQTADIAEFQLLGARVDGTRIRLRLKVTNLQKSREMDFSPMTMLKVYAGGDRRGELNPFEGKYQDFAIIPPQRSIIADLNYDFKTEPRNAELICTSKLNGEQVFYNLGF